MKKKSKEFIILIEASGDNSEIVSIENIDEETAEKIADHLYALDMIHPNSDGEYIGESIEVIGVKGEPKITVSTIERYSVYRNDTIISYGGEEKPHTYFDNDIEEEHIINILSLVINENLENVDNPDCLSDCDKYNSIETNTIQCVTEVSIDDWSFDVSLEYYEDSTGDEYEKTTLLPKEIWAPNNQ